MLKPVDPALFLSVSESILTDRSRPGTPQAPTPGDCPPRVLRPCVQRPNSTCCTSCRCQPRTALKLASRVPCFKGRKALLRGNQLAGEGVVLEPFWERPAGPKHTRAEQVES